MYYKLLLDTNIYESTAFSFNSPKFNELRSYVKRGILNLQINSVIDGEVRSHIRSHIGQAVTDLSRLIRKERMFSGFRNHPAFAAVLKPPAAEDWIDTALREFDQLLTDLGAEQIPVNGIDVEAMLDDYFNQRLPFEQKKPTEFKDAIFLRSAFMEIQRLSRKNNPAGSNDHSNLVFQDTIEVPPGDKALKDIYKNQHLRTDELIYVIVSADKGVWDTAEQIADLRPNEDVKVFEGLNEFLAFVAKQDKLAMFLGQLLEHGYASDEISEAAKVAVEDAGIDIELHDGLLEETEVISVEMENSSFYVLSAQEFSDGSISAKVAAEIEAQVELSYSYMDEDMSCWDHETKGYLWRTLCQERGSFETRFELILNLNISDLEADLALDIMTEEGREKLDMLLEKAVSSVEIDEMPDSLYLRNDDCIGHELIRTIEVPY